MREIKLRAWVAWEDDENENKPTGKMIYARYREFKRAAGFLAIDDMIQHVSMSGFLGITWMQFTGLRDKSGVEIYQDDVVMTDSGRALIVWSKDSAGFQVDYRDVGTWLIDAERSEVIGNTHENPELIPTERK